MSNLQYLNENHVLHHVGKGFFRIRVECLCGWELEGIFTAAKLLAVETERHISVATGAEAGVGDVR